MAPKIHRPSTEDPKILLAVVSSLACLAVGYVLSARIFDPGPRETDPNAEPIAASDAGEAVADATVDVPAPILPDVQAPPRTVIPVRIISSILQSCGDGDELNIPGNNCGAVPTVESALRTRLQRMGECAAAETAARTPERLLSVGIRVDFPRRTVTALLGRSTSLPNPLPYVACARTAVENMEELWTQQPPHARYLLYFAARFGPVTGGAPTPSTPIAAATPTATPSTPSTPAIDAGVAPTYPVVVLRRPEQATVTWSRAVVRDAPRNGLVVTRIPQNTAVEVTARSGGWWQIRVGPLQGWVFGDAIGRGAQDAGVQAPPSS